MSANFCTLRVSTIISGLLNVRLEEMKHTNRMLLHAFTSGLAVSLAFTCVNVLLLENHGTEKLPFIYLLSALVLLIAGYVYSKLEHRMAPGRLFTGVMIACAIWSVFSAYLLIRFQSMAAISLVYCGYFVLYLLNNLEYWGAAALLYDVRQGKRLFGLLSAGESLAKILGYAATPLLIKLLSIENLISISALAFGVSAWLIHQIVQMQSESFEIGHHHEKHAQTEKFKTIEPLKFLRKLRREAFNRNVALFALLSTLVYYTIHYGFLEKVEETHQNETDIAVFIASFFSIAKAANFLIKSFLSGRLLSTLGVRIMILVLPLMLLLINMSGSLGIWFGLMSSVSLIYIFSANMLVDETFRTSLHKPSYLVLFQPFAKNKRLEGHTLTKGIMEPLGMGIAGILLFALERTDTFTLENLTYYSLGISAFWMLATVRTTSSYKGVLSDALKNRIAGKPVMNVSKEEIDLIKNKKIHSSDPAERLYAIKLAGNELSESQLTQVVVSLLELKELPFILNEALDYVVKYKMKGLEDDILPLIIHPNNNVSQKAIHSYAQLLGNHCVDPLMRLISEHETIPVNDALAAILREGGLYGATRAGEQLLRMLEHQDEEVRMNAAGIIRMVSKPDYSPLLKRLLTDQSESVRLEAFKAAAALGNEELVPQMIQMACTEEKFHIIRRNFSKLKTEVFPMLLKSLDTLMASDESHPMAIKRMLLICCDLAKGPEHDALAKRLPLMTSELTRTSLIAELGRATYAFQKDIKKVIAKELKYEYDWMHWLVDGISQCTDKQINAILRSEMYWTHKRYLSLLSIHYRNPKIIQLTDHLLSGDAKSKAVALELLENSIHMKYGRWYINLLEKGLPESTDNQPSLEILEELIAAKNRKFCNAYSRGAALRFMTDHKIRMNLPDYLQFEQDKMLHQEYQLYLKNASSWN